MTALGSADIPVHGNELTRPAADARGADVYVRGHRLARPDCDAGPPEVVTGKAPEAIVPGVRGEGVVGAVAQAERHAVEDVVGQGHDAGVRCQPLVAPTFLSAPVPTGRSAVRRIGSWARLIAVVQDRPD
jgi:hypothetical protein